MATATKTTTAARKKAVIKKKAVARRKATPAKATPAETPVETKAPRKVQSRLTPDVVAKIKAEIANGTPDADIAAAHGATKRTVSRIRRGRVYQ